MERQEIPIRFADLRRLASPVPTVWLSDAPPSSDNLLTVGDFVASAAVGRFVKRERVYFRLVP